MHQLLVRSPCGESRPLCPVLFAEALTCTLYPSISCSTFCKDQGIKLIMLLEVRQVLLQITVKHIKTVITSSICKNATPRCLSYVSIGVVGAMRIYIYSPIICLWSFVLCLGGLSYYILLLSVYLCSFYVIDLCHDNYKMAG